MLQTKEILDRIAVKMQPGQWKFLFKFVTSRLVSKCGHVHVCKCVCVSSFCMSVCMSVYVCLFVHLSVCMYVCVHFLFVYSSVCFYIYGDH